MKRIKTRKISVSEEVYQRLIKDRDHFEKLIGGGSWGISDTIKEYFKILDNTFNQRGFKK